MYKQTEYYSTFPADKQWSVAYNDKTIDPQWTIMPKRISQRDEIAPTLEEFYQTWTDN
jgi:dTDP-4-dehydrorhamnose 3,5-epimerase-like enzyme